MSPHVSPSRLLKWPLEGNPKCELCNLYQVWEQGRWCEACHQIMERMGGRMVEFTTTGGFKEPKDIAPNERVEAWVTSVRSVETRWGDRIVWEFEDAAGDLYQAWTGISLNPTPTGQPSRCAEFIRGITGAIPSSFNSDLLLGVAVTLVGGVNQTGRPIIAMVEKRNADPKDVR